MSTVVANSTQSIGIPQYEGSPVAIAVETFYIQPGPQSTVVPSWVASASDFQQYVTDGVISSVTEAATATLVAGSTSANVAIPTSGSPTKLVVTNNHDSITAFVALGTTNAVAATTASTPIAPGQSLVLTIGGNEYIAAIVASGGAVLTLATGS